MVSARAAALLASPRLAGKTRIALLKELAALTEEQWVADLEAAAAALRAGPAPPAPGADGAAPELAAALVALGGGPEAERQLRTAALEQRFPGGLPEYGPTFHAVLSACTARQRLQRDCVVAALSSLPHGFDALDRALIVHAALISSAYDAYHRAWLRAVQASGLLLAVPASGVPSVSCASWAPRPLCLQLACAQQGLTSRRPAWHLTLTSSCMYLWLRRATSSQ